MLLVGAWTAALCAVLASLLLDVRGLRSQAASSCREWLASHAALVAEGRALRDAATAAEQAGVGNKPKSAPGTSEGQGDDTGADSADGRAGSIAAAAGEAGAGANGCAHGKASVRTNGSATHPRTNVNVVASTLVRIWTSAAHTARQAMPWLDPRIRAEFARMRFRYVAPATLLSLGQGFVEIWRAHVTGCLFDALTRVHAKPDALQDVWAAMYQLVCMQVYDWVAHIFTGYLFSAARWEMTLEARTEYFARIMTQDVAYLDAHTSAELAQRLAAEPEQMHQLVNHSLEQALRGLWAFLGGAVMMIRADWQLVLVATIVRLPMILKLGDLSFRFVDAYWWVQQDSLNKANNIASEAISNARAVQGCAAEPLVLRAYAAQIQRYLQVIRVTLLSETALRYTNLMLSYVVDVSILVFGVYRMSAGQLSLGEYTAFRTYLGQCFYGIESLYNLYAQLRSVGGKCEKYFSLRDRRPAIPLSVTDADSQNDDKRATHACAGDVEFRDVSFRYPSERGELPLVLRKVSFVVPSQRTVALVGRSGVGKSTLFRLLERFYDPTSGSIRVGGVDIRELEVRSLRRRVAVVDQDPVMFNASVRENICFGLDPSDTKAAPSHAEVVEAARRAHVHDVIEALPQGYNTIVGERGVKLSGGQRQRIAIARALVRRAPILLLDEATSALDSESETAVRAGILEATRRCTVIIIAHRLRTVQHADEILVLAEGQIAERGTHTSLLQNRTSLYRTFVREQVIDWPATAD